MPTACSREAASTPTRAITAGRSWIPTPDGSTLTNSLVGQENLNTGAETETLTVVGGTGIFLGATGGSTDSGTDIGGILHLNATGTIFLPPIGLSVQSTTQGHLTQTGSIVQISGNTPLNGGSGVTTLNGSPDAQGNYTGTVVDTAVDGSTLTYHLVGNENPSTGAVAETLTVIGGTGFFAGATGEVADQGTDINGNLQLQGAGTLFLTAASAPYQSGVTGHLTNTGSVSQVSNGGLLNDANGVFTRSSFDPATGDYSGTLVDTTADGSTLTRHLVGQENLTTGAVTETLTILGGTGIFLGATGGGVDSGTETGGNLQLTGTGFIFLADVGRLNGADWNGQIAGTASVSSSAPVQGVSVSLEDTTTDMYWDGASSFDNSSETFFPAVYAPTSSTSGTWSLAVSASLLHNGDSYTIHSKATDNVGNVQTSFGLATFVFDAAAPAAPSTPVLAPASDSGMVGDGITNVSTPTLTGTAEPNSSVQLTANGTSSGKPSPTARETGPSRSAAPAATWRS